MVIDLTLHASKEIKSFSMLVQFDENLGGQISEEIKLLDFQTIVADDYKGPAELSLAHKLFQ